MSLHQRSSFERSAFTSRTVAGFLIRSRIDESQPAVSVARVSNAARVPLYLSLSPRLFAARHEKISNELETLPRLSRRGRRARPRERLMTTFSFVERRERARRRRLKAPGSAVSTKRPGLRTGPRSASSTVLLLFRAVSSRPRRGTDNRRIRTAGGS